MVKITIKHNKMEKTLLVSEQKPVRDILDEADSEFAPFDDVALNGKKLSFDDMSRSILDLGFSQESELTFVIGEDVPWLTDDDAGDTIGSVVYPPKAYVVGCACIIFSAFTPDEIREFKRYMPDALTLRDEKGDPVFAIDMDEKSPGSLTKYGAVFSKKTTGKGNATITILIDPECDDTEASVRKSLGSAIISLVDLEEQLMAKMSELEKKKGLLQDYISVV